MLDRLGFINIFLSVALGALVFFVSGYLYIGDGDQYKELMRAPVRTALDRALFGFITGVIGLFVLVVANYIIDSKASSIIKELVVYSIILFVAAALLGGVVFINC